MAKDSAWIGDGNVQLYFVKNGEEDDEIMESFRRRSSQGVFIGNNDERSTRQKNFKIVLIHPQPSNDHPSICDFPIL